MTANKQTTQIELPPINLEIIEVTLIGDTPLISHAWSEKAKREMLGKHGTRRHQSFGQGIRLARQALAWQVRSGQGEARRGR
jgi:hypothetical protein